jgi:hypothetical protein
LSHQTLAFFCPSDVKLSDGLQKFCKLFKCLQPYIWLYMCGQNLFPNWGLCSKASDKMWTLCVLMSKLCLRTGDMTQAKECQPYKCKALSLNPVPQKKNFVPNHMTYYFQFLFWFFFFLCDSNLNFLFVFCGRLLLDSLSTTDLFQLLRWPHLQLRVFPTFLAVLFVSD